ncbi:MAG: hypothetical protein JWQ98_1403 [Chlorobi bacterium]|nr:hypothetical protein [Chlorobiota bacterium]
MASDNFSRKYSPDEVNAILRRALDRQGSGSATITHEDLLETARELGLEPAQVEAAMAEQEELGATENAKEAWKAQRKRKFFEHLRTYIIINSILILLDLFTGGHTWFIWPLFGWGIGLAFDASETFFPKDRDIERGARRMIERERRQQRQDVRIKGRGKSVTIDGKGGRIVIEKGDKRIEIG